MIKESHSHKVYDNELDELKERLLNENNIPYEIGSKWNHFSANY